MELNNKFILDACCGPKQMWFNKQHPNVLYIDIRKEDKGFLKWQPTFEINPDMIADFRDLPKELKKHKFKLIAWDPPHFIAKKQTGCMLMKFGNLHPETWPYDINKGFKELWSVLDDFGILILKWNNYHVAFQKMLKQIPVQPLFGNTSKNTKDSMTKWFCFMKIPKEEW